MEKEKLKDDRFYKNLIHLTESVGITINLKEKVEGKDKIFFHPFTVETEPLLFRDLITAVQNSLNRQLESIYESIGNIIQSDLRVGDKVCYQPEYRETDKFENGIVKEIPEHTEESARVVYNCGGDWENYQNYTAAMTNLRDLKRGWI